MLAGNAQTVADLTQQAAVKAGRAGAGSRKADGFDAFVNAEVVGARVLLAQAMGAVADHYAANAQALHGLGVPEIQATEQGRLFLQRHLGDDFLNFHTFPLSAEINGASFCVCEVRSARERFLPAREKVYALPSVLRTFCAMSFSEMP